MEVDTKAAFERRKAECYDDWHEYYLDRGDNSLNGDQTIDHSVQRAADNETLADAYVELMIRRESLLEQGEFDAPTLAWFEWLVAQLRISFDATNETRLAMHCSRRQEIALLIQDEMRLADVISTLEGWKSKFESCGAFDRPSPIIDETITLDQAHADLRGEYHDVSLLLASADDPKPRQELEFGKRYRVRVELAD